MYFIIYGIRYELIHEPLLFAHVSYELSISRDENELVQELVLGLFYSKCWIKKIKKKSIFNSEF